MYPKDKLSLNSKKAEQLSLIPFVKHSQLTLDPQKAGTVSPSYPMYKYLHYLSLHFKIMLVLIVLSQIISQMLSCSLPDLA